MKLFTANFNALLYNIRNLIFLVGFIFFAINTAFSTELDDVYRFWGKYKVHETPTMKLYYADSCGEVVPRIAKSLQEVRTRLGKAFPELEGFKVKVLLNDYDDRDTGSADTTFDLITLGVFEETDSLSTRGYSLDQRFAIRLAQILILRRLGSSHIALKRRISLLSIPPWFLEGMALFYACPMDALFTTRLLEMARDGRLFTLDEMDTFQDREVMLQEQMRFQARSMMEFWHSRAGPDAGRRFLGMINKRPIGFAETFREVFGMTIKEAFSSYNTYIKEQGGLKDAMGFADTGRVHGCRDGKFFQSLRSLPGDELVWVSSCRYREETYDLFRKSASGSPRVALKNVHPVLLADPDSRIVYIGKYFVNKTRQRRLGLWAVPPKGEAFPVTRGEEGLKPLSIADGRIYYLSIKNGKWEIRSVETRKGSLTRSEFIFPVGIHPLDLALDLDSGFVYFVTRMGDETHLCRQRLDFSRQEVESIYKNKGIIRKIFVEKSSSGSSNLWFSAEDDQGTVQLFRINLGEGTGSVEQISKIHGGVWDYQLRENSILVTTIHDKDFVSGIIDSSVISTHPASVPEPIVFSQLPEIKSEPYKLEYKSSYWLPKVTRDDLGTVLGVYSYRADTLDRSRIVVSPTYGFRSKNWGYVADLMKRYELFRTGLTFEDRVVGKSYRSNSYYERVRSSDLHFSYPFTLSTSITVGGNMTKRAIAKFPDNGGIVPTVGQDNSVYVQIYHRGIRTEPFNSIFPRKGRVYGLNYQKGVDWLGGQLKYDSMSFRWEEYIPVGDGFVAKIRAWFAEDDKVGDIRRPDDLFLGGSDFLRGYEGSVRYGDSLRAVSLHLGREIKIQIPFLRKWIQKEILVGEVFWERGDVRSIGRPFDFLEDAGFEIRARGLILRRVPVTLRWGVAWPRGGGRQHGYWGVDFSSITGLIR